MIKYQARFGGSDGNLHRRVFTCDTDEHAIVWAKQLMDGGPLELWSGARIVTRLTSPDDKQAVAYEMSANK